MWLRHRCGPVVPAPARPVAFVVGRQVDERTHGAFVGVSRPAAFLPYPRTPFALAGLLNILRARPDLAKAVRTLVLPNPCADDADLLRLLPGLWDLHITLPIPPKSPRSSPRYEICAPCAVRTIVLPNAWVHDAELIRLLPGLWDLDITLPPNSAEVDALVAAVRNLRTLRTLAVRKAAGTYLSQPAPRALLDTLADAVYASAGLTSTALIFPLSADPALTRLASALSTAPALQTLRTPLPSAWSPASLSVAANSMQARICLGGEEPAPSRPYFPSAAPAVSTAPPPRMPDRRLSSPAPSTYTQRRPIRPTALFLHAARPRRAHQGGTYICPNVGVGAGMGGGGAGGWRGRAATVGSAPQVGGEGGEEGFSMTRGPQQGYLDTHSILQPASYDPDNHPQRDPAFIPDM
ncbi:hypothetical protein C8R47DRAFT_1067054 [Mycena vitilis]|nr:hypothetical protein C8R47DRAFT_1067054 [Mycena vitilis]